ncbi:unnamed protein product [Cylindrotheca closterium]|uniref:Reverse transcriptase Ty1/copia-type domain-containing protein n=1 Tax=Cylindrotheca closterium TaxID=2856 RepID=A0AAD2CUU5_9STRA|nr:unnamed protein product [Cylindrotheca closterium]
MDDRRIICGASRFQEPYWRHSVLWRRCSSSDVKEAKLNSRSSMEAELIAVENVVTMILWTKLFMEWQGYPIEKNILYQDNKSAILLEENGRKCAGKRSRAINICYFFITDQFEKGNVKVEYCPTDDMIADFMTKPLQGEKFRKFRDLILGPQD